MLRTLTFAILLSCSAGAVLAQSASPSIAERKQILKGFGGASREPGAMLRGEAPFDLAKVQASLKTFADGSKKLPTLFPDDSKTGGETEALPIIWTEKDKFNAGFDKLAADATAASAAITDEASFKANIGKVLGNCRACHEVYRVKK